MWYQHRGNGCHMSKIWINCSEFECLLKSWVRYQGNQEWTENVLLFLSDFLIIFHYNWNWRTYRTEEDSVGWVEKKRSITGYLGTDKQHCRKLWRTNTLFEVNKLACVRPLEILSGLHIREGWIFVSYFFRNQISRAGRGCSGAENAYCSSGRPGLTPKWWLTNVWNSSLGGSCCCLGGPVSSIAELKRNT